MRLTTTNKDVTREMICRNENCGVTEEHCPHLMEDECACLRSVINKLADYEDAEEQGLLLRLPYPLGTEHIYYADEKDMDVYRLDAEKIEVHMMPIGKKIMYTIDCFEFFIEDFGKIVFLTEAEAESALAEKGGA